MWYDEIPLATMLVALTDAEWEMATGVPAEYRPHKKASAVGTVVRALRSLGVPAGAAQTCAEKAVYALPHDTPTAVQIEMALKEWSKSR